MMARPGEPEIFLAVGTVEDGAGEQRAPYRNVPASTPLAVGAADWLMTLWTWPLGASAASTSLTESSEQQNGEASDQPGDKQCERNPAHVWIGKTESGNLESGNLF